MSEPTIYHIRLNVNAVIEVCKKLFLPFLIILSSFTSLTSQAITIANAPKSIKKLYAKAEKLIKKNKISNGIAMLDKATKKEPRFIDAYLKRGVLYYEGASYDKAIENFESAIALDGEYDPRVWQALSVSHERLNNEVKALEYLKEYQSRSPIVKEQQKIKLEDKINSLAFIVEMKSNPVPFDPIMLPSAINTDNNSEYLPSLTADGNYLFFTRVTNNQEDLFYSVKDSTGEWKEAELMPKVNTHENEGAHCISADGKTILYTYCSDGRQGSAYGCNIYIAINRNGNWSNPKYFSAINSKSWDTQPNISSDGKTIIFTSSRKGGFGGSDLWYSIKNADNTWSNPVNMGPIINTPKDEASPFLHPDNETLFFMSNGHPSLGSFDLFQSKLNESASWSKPENLGYPINTEEKEGAMVVALDGRTAYYSRGNGKKSFDQTQSDIYTFDLPKHLAAAPVGFVKIRVLDAETKSSLIANLEIQSHDDEANSIENLVTDEEGTILLTIPLGKNYSLNVSKEKYYFHSERFELMDFNAKKSAFEILVLLDPIKEEIIVESAPIILKNVLFETGSFELLPESSFELDNLLNLLIENPDIRIEIRGHTDDVGEAAYNKELSRNRAKSVFEYLTAREIDASRMSFKGLGEQLPIDSNETEEGRKNNRRTEFVILK